MSTKYYLPEDKSPLPPKNADVLTTCCDYCIVACGYKVYRWPTHTPDGGPKANQNAFGISFPSSSLQDWVAPTQHNVVMHNGSLHNVVIVPDKNAKVVNLNGDASIRGGTIAQKCYNPNKPTKDRLQTPLMRINGILQPVDWDTALTVAAEVAKHVIREHGPLAYSVKTYSYQYIENTYAIKKFALRHIKTASFTFHDTPSNVTSTPGFRDAGFDNFAPAYSDWNEADVLMIHGTDPYETKTIIYTQYIKPAIDKGQKTIWLNPRETAGIAYAMSKGNAIHFQVYPGTDSLVLGAIARIILENGWEDKEWIKKWVNNAWESGAGFGQGTRNTPWQWRTTWNKFQTNGVYGKNSYKAWVTSQKKYEPATAAGIAGVSEADIYKAAEWLTGAGGKYPKSSFGIEKGFYWSNNTGNTNAVSALAIICGAGGRPGRMVGRFGGHQRGGAGGGSYPRNKSPEKLPGRRRRALDTDRWLVSGHTRFAHVIGTTWIQSMCGSGGLAAQFETQVTHNPHQIRSYDKEEMIATLKKRADSNGERRLRLYSKFYDAPGDAKPDWWIIAELGKKMGFDGFDWKDSNEVCEESSRFSRGSRKSYHMIKIAAHAENKTLHEKLRELGTTGIQGPTYYNYETGELSGSVRLHDTTLTKTELAKKHGSNGFQRANVVNKKVTHFNTQTGKQNIQKHPWSLFSDYWQWLKPRDNELWATNGRINEIWQSGFDDTQRRAYIAQRWPENFVEIHPDDAAIRGIESGDQVVMYSKRIPVYARTLKGVNDSDFQFSTLMKNGHIELKGVMFTNFLDLRQPSNILQGRVVDHISGNYNFKMGVAKIKKIGESQYKKTFRSMSFAPRNIV